MTRSVKKVEPSKPAEIALAMGTPPSRSRLYAEADSGSVARDPRPDMTPSTPGRGKPANAPPAFSGESLGGPDQSGEPGLREALSHAALVFLFFSLLFTAFFSPVLFSSRILPSDGQMVSFHSPPELWTNFLWSGFPAAADPQYESWYPLARLFHLLPHGFNAFMTLAYVLASCFTYGYIFFLTRQRFSALVAGTTFGMCGFLVSHLGHSAMIQAMLWLPLVIWSFEKLRRRFSVPWFIVAILASAANILGGHLQVFVYTWLLALAYAVSLGATARQGWLRYVSTCLAVLGLAGCLSTIQLLPTFEFSQLSGRTKLTFEEFVSFSLPVKQLIHLIFPTLFGGTPYSPYGIRYFGLFNYQELNSYIGILPLILAGTGAWVFRRQGLVLFWAAVVPLSLLMALGGATPLAAVLYHVPVINYFRAPARHFLEFSFAVSVLAGFGVAAVSSGRTSERTGRSAVVAASIGLLGSCALVYAFYDRLQEKASALQIELPSILANWAVIVPTLIFALSIAAFALWLRRPHGRTRQVALWTVILLNSATFGWFCEWRYHAIDARGLQTSLMSRYKAQLNASNQRVLPLGGVGGPPDMFRVYELNNVLGYGPLMLKRYSELSGASTSGSISPAALTERNHAIDLLAVAYVLEPAFTPSQVPPGCRFERVDTVDGAAMFRNLRAMPRAWLVPEAQRATAGEILASITDSRPVPDGTPFDPRRIALVEEPLKFKTSNPDPHGTVRVVRMTNAGIELESSSQTAAFLVMSDVYYPGWRATVNGSETHIFQTNYVLRGILLPPGRNIVRLDFRPLTFYIGAIVSGLTLAGLLLSSVVWILREFRRVSTK